MTQTAQAKTSPITPTPRDLQRQNLEQIVTLSIECTAQEERIEQQHTEATDRETAELNKVSRAAEQRRGRRATEFDTGSRARERAIQENYEIQKQENETAAQSNRQQIVAKKEGAEATLKKKMEEDAWSAESVMVALEMKTDSDEHLSKQDEKKSAEDMAALAQLESAARQALADYRVGIPPVEPPPLDSAIKQRLASERLTVLGEQQKHAQALLRELQELTKVRVLSETLPWLVVVMMAGICGAVGWMISQDKQNNATISGGAALGGLIVCGAVWAIIRHQQRKRIGAKAQEIFVNIGQSLAIARQAAQVDSEAAAAAREKRVKDARRKRDQDLATAKEEARALLNKTNEHLRAATTEESRRYQDQIAANEAEKNQGLDDLRKEREATTKEIEQEYSTTTQAAKNKHAQAMQAIEGEYETEFRALTAKWDGAMRAVSGLLAQGSGIDPQLADWHSPAWEQWKPPAEFSGRVRLGEMKVDVTKLIDRLPRRLQLPETFSVPAMLTLPVHGSLLVEADHSGRAAAVDVAQMVMARLLTQMPAGRVKFTLFDPVGLGQSFAGFMHLADHDESLVGSRIWTENEHMQQRLADLTEHMETVIQKYLRNEYATIDQYNAQAGELAEPIRYLVIADFPTAFEPETLRRLASIALTGPRCGVYTIILRDTRLPLPPGARMEDILPGSVHLVHKDGQFVWNDAVFKKFPLSVDAAPEEKTLTRLMDVAGKAAKEAKRVEVPFRSIAPPEGQFWSLSSKNDLRVPIGKSGAMRLQSLRLGVGVAQHTLVAGKTGSGKSNLMHTIVTNLAMWYGPEEVEFYLVDFKKGVEFKAYVTSELPHARAIAVESDREFGLSVLQRVDAELTRRGAMFRDVGAQEISGYRDRTGQQLPRCVLLIDEFQEFFSEDDKLSQEASGLLDRLVRQGRAFGVHLVLGSQTIGGTSGLSRSTLGQIAVRVALQCSEADSQMILGDNNSAARLLTRPGEAVYNDAGGLVEANSPFQIAFLPDEQREQYLERIHALSRSRNGTPPTPIVFEGNSPAIIRKNQLLMGQLERANLPQTASVLPAYIGEPVAIKEPTAIRFRRQSGVNVLMVGQQEQSAIAVFSSIAVSLAAQSKPGEALFYLFDGSPADSPHVGLLERVMAAFPQQVKVIPWRQTPEAINELAMMQKERQGNDGQGGPAVFAFLFGLQRYRLLRRQEDDFSFSRGEEPAAPKPDKQFAELLSEGPAMGIHTILWADTPITLERTLERSAMRQFDYRILFQMSATDSSNLIDSPLANRLGAHRALLYSEEQGTVEKFRPYELPNDAWLGFVSARLKNRKG